jgi:DNA-binding SARP family transcriptional activator/tetratricopeptide (TPR) repeat protein
VTDPAIEFAVLGPLQVSVSGRSTGISSARQRTLLAALVLSAGRPVPRDRLAGLVWDGAQPHDPRAALHSQVMRLRRALGAAGAAVRTDGEAYLLDVDPLACDVHRFRSLVRTADDAEDPAGKLREALALWRGEAALADISSDGLAPSAAALAEERLEALERRIGFDLAAGRHATVVAELSELTGRTPLREQLWVLLITALCRNGRQGEALAVYRDVRAMLRDELGVDPGSELQRVHAAALAGTLGPAERPDVTPGSKPVDTWSAQQQLPLEVADFVGRERVAAEIADALRSPTGVPVVVISGLAGVGKSALATHVAHRVRDAFPDGQWHLRLGGGSGDRRTSEQLLDGLLRSTGAEPAAIPAAADEQAAMLRGRLAGRRVLLVLDDAVNAAQVEPLLPGAPGSAVLVTSRSQLAGLTALHGARPYPLDALPAATSYTLFELVLGSARTRAEPAAAQEIADLCGHLPLALRIAAANLSHHPSLDLADYARRLRGDRLGQLSIPGSPLAVREAFDVSVDSLPAAARHAFALLGQAPGADLSAGCAAALFGTDATETGRMLDLLCSANLLLRSVDDRYVMHDLVRAHASSRADLLERETVAVARDRLLAWYLETIDAANVTAGFFTSARLPRPPGDPTRFVDAGAARSWLDTEMLNLIAAVNLAADVGPEHYAWEITDALRLYLHLRRHIAAWYELVGSALTAADAKGDVLAQGAMQHSRAQLAFSLLDREAGQLWYEQALESYRRADFALGAAVVLSNIGVVRSESGDLDGALASGNNAIAAYRAAGRPELGAIAIANRSSTHLLLGHIGAAIEDATAALDLHHARARLVALINRSGAYGLCGRYDEGYVDAADALALCLEREDIEGISVGQTELARRYLDLGDTAPALGLLEQALRLARETSDPVAEAEALVTLGQTHRVAGRNDQAIEVCRTAVACASSGAQRLLPGALIALAAALRQIGDRQPAKVEAERAARLAVRESLRIDESRASGVLAVVCRELGQEAAGERHARHAAMIAAETGFVPAPYDVYPDMSESQVTAH